MDPQWIHFKIFFVLQGLIDFLFDVIVFLQYQCIHFLFDAFENFVCVARKTVSERERWLQGTEWL